MWLETSYGCPGCYLSRMLYASTNLYEGKTDKCHPAVQFPESRDVSHTANHWSNEASMIQRLNI